MRAFIRTRLAGIVGRIGPRFALWAALAWALPATVLAQGDDSSLAPSPRALGRVWTLVQCGALLAVPGEDPLSKVSVLVDGVRVREIRRGFVDPVVLEIPSGVEVRTVDLTRSFCMPGLIDAHTHMTREASGDRWLRFISESDAKVAIRATGFARRTLEAGFTTVRDLGSSGRAAFALRDAIEEGLVVGPRMLVAGAPITPTGGHGDPTLGFREDLLAPPGALEGVADGPVGVRKAVRLQVKRGADVIKLTATGGVLSNTAAGTDQQFFDDELEAIVKTARSLGRRVAAHAHGADGIKAALVAGVDSIEHGTYLDDAAIRLFLQRGAYYVPTVLAGETVAERARVEGYYPAPVRAKALEIGPRIKDALRRAHSAGVKIAFGTDSGVSRHGENAREFAYMVEAGMTEMEALRAATVGAADLLGVLADVGTVEVGKRADLVATARNPLIDITELQRVVFVMKDGTIYKRR